MIRLIPTEAIPWPSIAFVIFSNAAILAIFGSLIGWFYQKHHRTLQAAGAHSGSPTPTNDQYGEKPARGHWAVMRKGVILGAATGMLLTVGCYILLRLSNTGDSLMAWVTAPGLLLFEPARFLALKLGWSVNAYPITWRLLLWGMVVNSIAFMFIGVIIDHAIRTFYRVITSK